ncbi:response regulator transcription factor [Polymorphobacter arshaanensis]|uniref:Response regulator transcription factor n=1 Tax=Glacieibacterium arshaanense TaxID=2511025 RepID=A0A4Y9EPL2_9SPHN|nr:response regulator transcription factor [Polymorphobacter arshaanensis]TFU03650.1 response regulator transcription factor [Polymorphobacter arshaanensis]
MTGARILIVDDELHIRRLLRASLERAGYVIAEAVTARELLSVLPIDKPDLVLLDLGLPDRDGLELLPLLGAVPVIVVSARESVEEKVAALDLGAVDYVTKPFDSDELLARVRAALRQRRATQTSAAVVRVDDVEIDLDARSVRRSGAEVHLTPKEYGLLAALAAHPGRVITHGQLLRSVWGPAHEASTEYLRVTVRGLRAKLEADAAAPRLILNEPGVGYRLAK